MTELRALGMRTILEAVLTLPKYRIFASSFQRFFLDVKAESAADALKQGWDTDGGEFTPADLGDWEIEHEPVCLDESPGRIWDRIFRRGEPKTGDEWHHPQ